MKPWYLKARVDGGASGQDFSCVCMSTALGAIMGNAKVAVLTPNSCGPYLLWNGDPAMPYVSHAHVIDTCTHKKGFIQDFFKGGGTCG